MILHALSVAGEQKERCQPISHCWTPDSKLYCGCKGGQIISIDTETNRVTMVLNPSVQELQRDRTETLSLLRKTATMESIAEIEEEQSKWFCSLCFSHFSLLILVTWDMAHILSANFFWDLYTGIFTTSKDELHCITISKEFARLPKMFQRFQMSGISRKTTLSPGLFP